LQCQEAKRWNLRERSSSTKGMIRSLQIASRKAKTLDETMISKKPRIQAGQHLIQITKTQHDLSHTKRRQNLCEHSFAATMKNQAEQHTALQGWIPGAQRSLLKLRIPIVLRQEQITVRPDVPFQPMRSWIPHARNSSRTMKNLSEHTV
jgi:ribosomal protein L3